MALRKKPLPKLSINYILKHVTPELIFSQFWNIPQHEITYAITSGSATYAPYREDKDASLGFYEKNGKLYARDWAGYFWGDCFDCVGFCTGRGSSGAEFGKILETIAKTFNIHRYANENSVSQQFSIERKQYFRERMIFTITERPWNIQDKYYWKDRYNISRSLLQEYKVYPVNTLTINGLLRYTYDKKNPAYAYYFGTDKNGIQNWKVYFPYADKKKGQRKFLQNCSMIEGGMFIKKAKVGVITKSYKDVIAIESISRANSLSILALAPSSESTIITPIQYTFILKHTPIIYTLSDYDKAGIKFAAEMRRRYNTTPLFFTKGYFGKFDFKAKDLTDNIEEWGIERIEDLVTHLYHNGLEDLQNYLVYDFSR